MKTLHLWLEVEEAKNVFCAVWHIYNAINFRKRRNESHMFLIINSTKVKKQNTTFLLNEDLFFIFKSEAVSMLFPFLLCLTPTHTLTCFS